HSPAPTVVRTARSHAPRHRKFRDRRRPRVRSPKTSDQHSSIHAKYLARDVCGKIRSKKQNGPGHVFGGPDTRHLDAARAFLEFLARQLPDHVGINETGSDSIHTDIRRGQFFGCGACQPDYRRLATAIDNLPGVSHSSDNRAEVDYRTILMPRHEP